MPTPQCSMTVSVVCACLTLSSAAAQEVPSRMFKAEGHGVASAYLFADDEVRRLTALHDVVTPHVRWAKPLLGGPVRVLAVAHKSQGRWPVELAQRFDFDVTTVYCHGPERLGAPKTGMTKGMINQDAPDVVARLLQAMNDPVDAIVNDVPLATLGPVVVERLAELLAKGVGYVGPTKGLDLTGRSDAAKTAEKLIAASVPIKALRRLSKDFDSPGRAAGKILELWDDPKAGRLADPSRYPRDADKPDANRLQYLWLVDMEQEAWCSLVGRAVLWAARRLPEDGPLKIQWPQQTIRRDAMPCELPIDAPKDASMAVQVWDADGRPEHQGSSATLPPLPAGRHFVGVRLLRSERVTDWQFGTLLVQCPVTIASIELDGIHKKPDERIRAKVTLTGSPPPGAKLRFDVIDNYGRSVCRAVRDASKETTFEGEFAESLHIYNYANVRLLAADGALLAEDRRAFYVARPGPPRDDLSWIVWEAGAAFNPRSRILLKQFARLGMAGALTSGDGIEAAVMANAHPVAYAFRMHGGVSPDKNGVASPCITSPGFRSSTVNKIKQEATRLGPYAPLFFYLGDDVSYLRYGQDACWSDTCRAVLADWARKRYDTVAKVNEAWETSYASFDQIAPVKHAEALAAAAKGQFGPLCHWVDHQLCADAKVAGLWRDLGTAIHEVAPRTPSNMGSAVVGWTWPGSGFDFWKLAEGKDLVFQYPNPWVHDIFRCAARRDAFHGTWYGGYGLYTYPPHYDPDYFPWWSVFRGINLHGQYYGGQGTAWFSERLLGADLGPLPTFQHILANFKELKGGVAKLLFNANRENDGIAIAYSPASLHASAVFEKGLPKAAEWEGMFTDSNQYLYMQCWEGMSYLLRDMGFSFDVVPSSQIEDGRFLDQSFRVLVLPLNLRLTAGEAETIRRFVRGGGTLVADALTGVFDGQCRANHNGVLADVLGVRFDGGLPGAKIAMQDAMTADGHPLGRVVANSGVSLAGAQAHAKTESGTPILTVHECGKGHAVLLNLLSRDYQIWRTLATEMTFRDAVADVLAKTAQLTPEVRCDVECGREKKSHRIQATEIHRCELGGARYVGLLQLGKLRPDDVVYMADMRPKSVWITFDEKAHVYDVRRRMYRGLTDRVEDVIYPARAELYALLPYEVRDLVVAAQPSEGAITVSARVVPGDPEAAPVTHVFHLEVTDPTGRPRPELTSNLLAKGGRIEQRLFVGYDAPQGSWRIRVRDVASGTRRLAETSNASRSAD
ncbi:MAG: beta-galactosidase trimerization domain-containing protein [Phycisphaerae bacterium]|nr:beta-galactosidase trimerization domain-containing protein [Phycisphaerae bacterium]